MVKPDCSTEELVENWTLLPQELDLLARGKEIRLYLFPTENLLVE